MGVTAHRIPRAVWSIGRSIDRSKGEMRCTSAPRRETAATNEPMRPQRLLVVSRARSFLRWISYCSSSRLAVPLIRSRRPLHRALHDALNAADAFTLRRAMDRSRGGRGPWLCARAAAEEGSNASARSLFELRVICRSIIHSLTTRTTTCSHQPRHRHRGHPVRAGACAVDIGAPAAGGERAWIVGGQWRRALHRRDEALTHVRSGAYS